MVEALTGQPITQNELNTITNTGTGVGSNTGQSQTNSEELPRSGQVSVPDVSGGLGLGGTGEGNIQSRLRNEPALQVSSIQGSRVVNRNCLLLVSSAGNLPIQVPTTLQALSASKDKLFD